MTAINPEMSIRLSKTAMTMAKTRLNFLRTKKSTTGLSKIAKMSEKTTGTTMALVRNKMKNKEIKPTKKMVSFRYKGIAAFFSNSVMFLFFFMQQELQQRPSNDFNSTLIFCHQIDGSDLHS